MFYDLIRRFKSEKAEFSAQLMITVASDVKNRFHFDLLTGEEIDEIHRASLEVLEKTGVAFFHEGALKLFDENGARVNFKKGLVKFPPSLVKDAIRKVSKEFAVYSRNLRKRLDIGVPNTYFANSTYDLWILDYRTGERRGATLKDVEKFVVIDDALGNIDIIGPQVVPKDIPIPLMQIKAVETVFKNTTKPSLINLLNLEDARYVLEMAEAVAGDGETLRKRPIVIVGVCPDSPLRYGKAQIDVLYETAHHGIPIHIGPAPIAGMSSPVTLAGMLVQMFAESLAGIVLLKLLDEDLPVLVGQTPFMMAPKGNLVIGAPECYLVAWACTQILHHLGIPNNFSATNTDSKIPTIQSGYEKSMGLLMAVLSGSCVVTVPATFDEGTTTAFEQHVIELEMVNATIRILEGIRVSSDTLATDVIQQVGQEGKFLSQKHTLEHYRSECWLPEILFKDSWGTFEEDKRTIIDNAEIKIHEILQAHRPEPLPQTTQKELERIVRKAEKNLI